MPAHEWDTSTPPPKVRFRNPDGNWGPWASIVAPAPVPAPPAPAPVPPPPPAPVPANVTIAAPVLDKASYKPGELATVSAKVNVSAAPLNFITVVLSCRPPGVQHTSAPYNDFFSESGGALLPGERTFSGTWTFPVNAQGGAWDFFLAYQDSSGWHDGPSAFVNVEAAAPVPAPPAPSPAPAPAGSLSYEPKNAVSVAPGSNLQAVADASKIVSLKEGAYGELVVRSGMVIVCLPNYRTRFSKITFEPGAKNFRVEGMYSDGWHFSPGAEIGPGVIANIIGPVFGNGAKLRDIDLPSSFRSQHFLENVEAYNLRWIRTQTHDSGAHNDKPAFTLTGKGDGNIIVDQNALAPRNGSLHVDGQTRFMSLGLDEETYYPRVVNNPAIRVGAGVGEALVAGLGGSSPHSVALNSSAGKTYYLLSGMDGLGDVDNGRPFIRSMPAWAKWTRRTPVERLTKRTVPASSGNDTAMLQAAMNNGGVLSLDRDLWIDKQVNVNAMPVIKGNGFGIVQRDPSLPVLNLNQGNGERCLDFIDIFDVALIGGRVGIYHNKPNLQASGFVWSHVIFQDQRDAGIENGTESYAFDQGMIQYCTFVGAPIGWKQKGLDRGGVDHVSLGYIDKTMAYKCVFDNTVRSTQLDPVRANNMPGFVECDFLKPALFGGNHNYLTLVGCTGEIQSASSSTLIMP